MSDGPRGLRPTDQPPRGGCLLALARAVCEEVVAGTTPPSNGARKIWILTLRMRDEHVDALDVFIRAANEWEDRPEDRAAIDGEIVLLARELLA